MKRVQQQKDMEVAAPCLVLGKGKREDRRVFALPVGQGLCAREAPAGALSCGTSISSPGLY